MPLDYVCVKSGVLCPRCQGLVDSGKVDREEVDVMKALVELEETSSEFKWLKNVNYVKSYIAENLAIVVLEASGVSPPQVSRLSRALSDKLGLRVKVATSASDPKMLAGQLLYPARILGINTLWLPDGTTRYNIRIRKRDTRYLPASQETVEKLLSKILKMPVKLKLE